MTGYFRELTQAFGRGWNGFWFTPRDATGVCLMRIAVGVLATYFLLGHAPGLITWFGADGLLTVETVQRFTNPAGHALGGSRPTFLDLIDVPVLLWIVHATSLVAVIAFTVGLFTRVSSVASLVVVLAYVHRAPMVTGQFEPVLTMLLLYLCIAPCGAVWSVDAWRRSRSDKSPRPSANGSISANVSIRLMQLHVAAFYFMMGATKLAGETWWSGDAAWWLIAHSESRLVDLTGLAGSTYLINFWTHGIVAFELAFALLIWNRLARPALLCVAVVMWSSLSLVTGLISFAAVMLIGGLCYLTPDSWSRIHHRFASRSS